MALGRRWLCLLLVIAGIELASAEDTASRFQRTVDALEEVDDELRARFATVALVELAEIYLAEADLARSEAVDSDSAARLRGWSRAVEQYAQQLLLVMEDVELGFPVELRSYAHEVPSVSVAGRTVFLAHPRSDQQGAFEQSVLTRFCTGSTCAALTVQELERSAPIPMSPGLVTPEWHFSAAGPVCDFRGIQVQFGMGGQLAAQKALCQQLMQEAALLATELAWQRRHGVVVDWQALSLRATPQRPEHLVILNAAGDTLLITAPLLYSTQGLLDRLTGWLQAYGRRDETVSIGLVATELGWE